MNEIRQPCLLYIWCVLVLLALLLCSCASKGSNIKKPFPAKLAWPSPPEATRIRWLTSFSRESDIGTHRVNFWKKLVSFIIGKKEHRIIRPYGVYAWDQKVVVADPGAGVIHLFDLKEKRYRILSSANGEKIVLPSPIGVSGDGEGLLYITDSVQKKVYTYALATKKLSSLTSAGFRRPTGIAYNNKNGFVYVSDTLAHEIIGLDHHGVEQLRFGGRGGAPGKFNYPTDLFVDNRGYVWVTDSMNFRIQAFTPEGKFATMFGEPGNTSGRFAKPKGVAVDSEGHVYVCDALFDTVQIFDQAGHFLLNFGERGVGTGYFWMPSGLFIDSQDRIYVSDTYNQRVQVFQYVRDEN